MAWLAVAALVAAGFWTPVIIAAARGTARIGLVILLTLLTPVTGVSWFGALFAACTLPRALPRPPRRARPLPPAGGRPAGYGPRPAAPARPAGTWR